MKASINKELFVNYLKENNMTMTQLSKKAGTTASVLSKFLNGYTKSIKASTLTGLISAMNLDEKDVGKVFLLSNDIPKGK